MYKVTLTNFIDFSFKTGTSRLAPVKKQFTENSEPYDPAKDYYRRFREAVRNYNFNGRAEVFLTEAVKTATPRKVENYRLLAKGYSKFMRKLIEPDAKFREPDGVDWEGPGVAIRINPELCYYSEQESIVIKMYTKKEALKQKQADAILHLMQLAYRSDNIDESFAILDVRRSRLFSATAFDPEMSMVLMGEASAFSAMYDQLQKDPSFLVREEDLVGAKVGSLS